MVRLRPGVVFGIVILSLLVPAYGYALGDSANSLCLKDWDYSCNYLQGKSKTSGKLCGLGFPCQDVEGKITVTEGSCTAALHCEATKCLGGPCKKTSGVTPSTGGSSATPSSLSGLSSQGATPKTTTSNTATPNDQNSILQSAFSPKPLTPNPGSFSQMPDSQKAGEFMLPADGLGNYQTVKTTPTSAGDVSQFTSPESIANSPTELTPGAIDGLTPTPVRTTTEPGQSYTPEASFASGGDSGGGGGCSTSIMSYACFSSVSASVGNAASQAWDATKYAANELFGGSAQAAPRDPTAYQSLQDAFGVACKVYSCDPSFSATAAAGVCMQEARCDPNVEHLGSQYQGLPQTNTMGMIAGHTVLQDLAKDPNLNAADQAKVQGVLDRYDQLTQQGLDPRKDPVVGAWLLASQQMELPLMKPAEVSPVETADKLAGGDPIRAAAIMQTGQIAPAAILQANQNPDAPLSIGAIHALQQNAVPVSYGDSFNTAIDKMVSSKVYANNFSTGVSDQTSLIAQRTMESGPVLAYAPLQQDTGGAGDVPFPISATNQGKVIEDVSLPPTQAPDIGPQNAMPSGGTVELASYSGSQYTLALSSQQSGVGSIENVDWSNPPYSAAPTVSSQIPEAQSYLSSAYHQAVSSIQGGYGYISDTLSQQFGNNITPEPPVVAPDAFASYGQPSADIGGIGSNGPQLGSDVTPYAPLPEGPLASFASAPSPSADINSVGYGSQQQFGANITPEAPVIVPDAFAAYGQASADIGTLGANGPQLGNDITPYSALPQGPLASFAGGGYDAGIAPGSSATPDWNQISFNGASSNIVPEAPVVAPDAFASYGQPSADIGTIGGSGPQLGSDVTPYAPLPEGPLASFTSAPSPSAAIGTLGANGPQLGYDVISRSPNAGGGTSAATEPSVPPQYPGGGIAAGTEPSVPPQYSGGGAAAATEPSVPPQGSPFGGLPQPFATFGGGPTPIFAQGSPASNALNTIAGGPQLGGEVTPSSPNAGGGAAAATEPDVAPQGAPFGGGPTPIFAQGSPASNALGTIGYGSQYSFGSDLMHFQPSEADRLAYDATPLSQTGGFAPTQTLTATDYAYLTTSQPLSPDVAETLSSQYARAQGVPSTAFTSALQTAADTAGTLPPVGSGIAQFGLDITPQAPMSTADFGGMRQVSAFSNNTPPLFTQNSPASNALNTIAGGPQLGSEVTPIVQAPAVPEQPAPAAGAAPAAPAAAQPAPEAPPRTPVQRIGGALSSSFLSLSQGMSGAFGSMFNGGIGRFLSGFLGSFMHFLGGNSGSASPAAHGAAPTPSTASQPMPPATPATPSAPASGAAPAPSSNNPTITLIANPASVSAGGHATISWHTTNVAECFLKKDGVTLALVAVNGERDSGALASSTVFGLECSGQGKTVSSTTTVAVH